jgi:hypothetical protein
VGPEGVQAAAPVVVPDKARAVALAAGTIKAGVAEPAALAVQAADSAGRGVAVAASAGQFLAAPTRPPGSRTASLKLKRNLL